MASLFITVFLLLSSPSFHGVNSLTHGPLSKKFNVKYSYEFNKASNPTKIATKCKKGNPFSYTNNDMHRSKCVLCPEPEEEDSTDLDRRESLFALLGSVWALTTGYSPRVNAAYGDDAKIELPNVVDNIQKRTELQCLVESLGSRECLVYLDPEKKLYKGPDSEILLNRLETIILTLNSIPDIITSKKWSQVSNKLAGPMGTLNETMNKLVKNASDVGKATTLSKSVKDDIIAIGLAVDRKQGDIALESQRKAMDHLNEFILSL